MSLFRGDQRLYPFQLEHLLQAVNKLTTLLAWDCGCGKSPTALALASVLLDDGLVDHVVLIAEANKIIKDEWPDAIERFTSIDWKLYHGTPAKREKIRADLPQLILTTFDIIKRDAAIFPPKGRYRSNALPQPGPLLDALEGHRTLVIFDEITRLANRGSNTHKANKLLVDSLRAGAGAVVLALTATPMERDPESLFNLGRILVPESMPTVAGFENDYVAQFDIFRNPSRFKNLNASTTTEGVIPFTDRIDPIVLRKRKTDPDVIDFFPRRRELPPTFVTLGKDHQKFYDRVRQIGMELPEYEQRKFVTVLRQIAAHPMSLTLSHGQIAKEIVEHVSPEGLEAMGSAKTARMLAWCQEVVRDQGAQAVIFTFFADSVIPLLQEALESNGYSVSVNRGSLSLGQKNLAQQTFRAGDTQIFLTSDAGSKGINLPEATYLLHYERPSTHANLIQRSDRIHRIDSISESVYIYSLVARDTIEEGLYQLNLRRNDWSDKLLGDDEAEELDFVTAADRRQLLHIGKARAKEPT